MHDSERKPQKVFFHFFYGPAGKRGHSFQNYMEAGKSGSESGRAAEADNP